MKSSRIFAFAFAAIFGLGALAGSAKYSSASADDLGLGWLSNKDYVSCLELFYTGNFLMPPNLTPSQIAARHEQGRRYCNRVYYGHD